VTNPKDSIDDVLASATDEELARIENGEEPHVVVAARRAQEIERQRVQGISDDGSTPFDELLMRLAIADSMLSRRVDDATAVVQWENGAVLVVARGVRERARSLAPLAKELIPSGLVVVIVDGDAADVKAMQGVMPSVVVTRVHVLCAPRGVVSAEDARALGKHPARAPLTSTVRPHVDDYEQHVAASEATLESNARFAAVLARQKPVATAVLAVCIAIVYAAEVWLGALEFSPMLLRMGALHAESVRQGEVWRLLTVALLHGSVVHVVFNTFVLVMLGRSLERLLGTSRFTILFMASVLGGALLSIQFLGDRQGVGASGGIWGLLAAEAMLVFVRKDVMSPLVLARARTTTKQALIINALYSLQPNVDWAAHAGGAVVGALLVGSGILLVGVPRFADRATHTLKEPLSLKLVALSFTALLVAAGVTAAVVGDPLALRASPPLVSTLTDPLDITLELPRGMRVGVEKDGESTALIVGEILRDGLVLIVAGARYSTPLDTAAQTAEVEGVRAAFATGLPGSTWVGAVEVVDVRDAGTLVISRQRYENGVPAVRVMRISADLFVVVTITHFATLPFDAEALAKAIAMTAKPRAAESADEKAVEN
jgi:rhomboid protease GluP